MSVCYREHALRKNYEEYARFVEATFANNPDRAFEKIFPLESNTNNPYEELGISLHDAGLVYCYPYPEHMPFLCKFLAENTNEKTHFILPWYSETKKYASILPLMRRETIAYSLELLGPNALVSIFQKT